jgi:hypothetical protein
VERQRVEIEVTELTVDDAKAAYIERQHNVTAADVSQVMEGVPHFFLRRGRRGDEYSVLGLNRAGRYLVIAIAQVHGGEWRLVTAYWLNERRGRRLYDEGS